MKKVLTGSFWVLMLLLLTFSCRKEHFRTGAATLNPSRDTVWFDTVFTRMPGSQFPPSVTRFFVIANPYKDYVRTNIRLAGGNSSPFKLNIDGNPVNQVVDYEIRPNDSIYVFVQARLDANNQSNPLLVLDSVFIETGGVKQNVKLAAYGWDAYYFRDSVLNCNINWSDKQKPYVIINSALVPKNCSLTINEGVKIYNNPRSALYVEGTLLVKGTKAEPVIIQGARLEQQYADFAGQWQGIHFLRGSVNNSISFATVKNSYIGIRVDSLPENANPNLVIKNSFILNSSLIGILGITSKIYAENTVVSNTGSYTVLGYFGGDYDFRHCTFANYSGSTGRKDPLFVMNNKERSGDVVVKTYDLKYNIQNCIIYGNIEEELGFDVELSKLLGANIEKNLIKTKNKDMTATNLVYKDPRFVDPSKNKFSLDTLSPAHDAGMVLSPAINTDIIENPRDSKPDIGAYERKN